MINSLKISGVLQVGIARYCKSSKILNCTVQMVQTLTDNLASTSYQKSPKRSVLVMLTSFKLRNPNSYGFTSFFFRFFGAAFAETQGTASAATFTTCLDLTSRSDSVARCTSRRRSESKSQSNFILRSWSWHKTSKSFRKKKTYSGFMWNNSFVECHSCQCSINVHIIYY